MSLRVLPILLWPLLGACGGEVVASRPNVVLIVLDTQRADRLSCYGYGRETSPRIDELAAAGARFASATAQCSWTRPSMVSLFSSRWLTSFREVFREDAATLAEIFREAGYRTVGIVGNPLLTAEDGFDRGFDVYDADPAPRSVQRARKRDLGMRDLTRWIEELAPLALARVDEVLAEGSGRPLLLYLHVMDAHGPYRKHEELAAVLPLEEGRDSFPTPAQAARFAKEGAPAPSDDPGWKSAWERIRAERRRYDREVLHMDTHLGELLDALRARGVLDGAIVAVVADHGEGLWELPELLGPTDPREVGPNAFFQGGHSRNLYQCLVHTPFLLTGTGIPEGLVVTDPVCNVDLLPTLLELCDIADPGGWEGRSLAPLLRGEPMTPRDQFAAVLQSHMVLEAETGLKLVRPTPAGEAWNAEPLLFDLRADPGEQDNLYDSRPDDVRRLERKLDEWVAAHPDEGSLSLERNPRTVELLRSLGYTGY